jgi:hypothetical protein
MLGDPSGAVNSQSCPDSAKSQCPLCDSAVKQVIEGGGSVAAVARSLEMSGKTLANWAMVNCAWTVSTTKTGVQL